MGCDDDIVKCLVFWSNFFLALVGICLLSLGITYKINFEEFSYAVPKEYQGIVIIPVLTIPLGTLLIAVAVFGCYGCLAERFNFVALYTVVLFLLFVIQFTVGVSSYYQLGELEVFNGKLNLTLDVVFRNYHYHLENKAVVDLIQHRLKCCGFNGSNYWHNTPRSCYITDSRRVFESPCPPSVSGYIHESLNILGTSVIVLSFPEIIGAVMSFFFAFHLKNRANAREFVFIKDYTIDNGLL